MTERRRYRIVKPRPCKACGKQPGTHRVDGERRLPDGKWKSLRAYYDLCPGCAAEQVEACKMRDKLAARRKPRGTRGVAK